MIRCIPILVLLVLSVTGRTAELPPATQPKSTKCYIAALEHLARGDYNEAYESARQANQLRPKYKPYEQLLAELEPIVQRSKLRSYALAAGKEDESSVERLAQYLSKGTTDEEARAWLLYCWIADRIAYDIKSFLSGDYVKKDYSPAVVLKQRLAVCDGYSKLYSVVGKEMGLEVISINGHAKGYGYREDADFDKFRHSWNAVKIGGKWRLIEATWGAGNLKDGQFEKRFDDYYFSPPAQWLIMTHYPLQEEHQFLETPIRLDQFKSWMFMQVKPLLRCGFDQSAIRDSLAHKVQPVEAYPLAFPLKVQAPLERELDSRKRYSIKVKSLAAQDLAIVHGGKWYFATKRGDTFTCIARGMEGDILVVVKPFGQQEYKSILKYRGIKGKKPAPVPRVHLENPGTEFSKRPVSRPARCAATPRTLDGESPRRPLA